MRTTVEVLLACLAVCLSAAPLAAGLPDIPQCAPDFTPRKALWSDGQVPDVVFVDVDGDNDLDGVTAPSGNSLVWRENTDGGATFGSERVITSSRVRAFAAGDLNGDGDVDMVIGDALFSDRKVAWIENLGAGSSWGAEQMIVVDVSSFRAVAVADLDGDGDLDVVSAFWSSNGILVSENLDGDGTFGAPVTIATVSSDWVVPADVDGDSDIDLLALVGDVVWYENADGSGPVGPAHVINVVNADAVRVADVDGDGDLDAVVVAGQGIVWHENVLGNGTFGPERVVAMHSADIRVLQLGDFDGDGDVDCASVDSVGSGDQLFWYENVDGKGGAWNLTFISNRASSYVLEAGDLDGDGDIDLISYSGADDTVDWYRNLGGTFLFDSQLVVSTATASNLVLAADLDGDGDLDLAAASSDDSIVWFENADGLGAWSLPKTVATAAESVNVVVAADLDSDGDLDLVSGSYGDRIIGWYENTDGAGTFGPRRVVVELADWFDSVEVVAADLDGDGDLDLAVAFFGSSSPDPLVAWYDNVDGGTVWEEHEVDDYDDAADVAAADVDGDGDVDLVGFYESAIVWYANDGEAGVWTGHVVITSDESDSDDCGVVDAITTGLVADIDGDGDVDLVTFASDDCSYLAWHENVAGNGTAWVAHVVSTEMDGAERVAAVDLDGDGDLDLVATDLVQVAWFENVVGNGTFGPLQVMPSEMPRYVVVAADLDGDADIDLVVASSDDDTIAWFPQSSRGFFETFKPEPRVVAHAAGTSPTGSFAALARSISGLSRCVRDTLVLPPGVYKCSTDSAFELNFAIRLEGGEGGEVVFECDGGVLFRLAEGDGTAGDLEMVGITVRGTGVAPLSTFGSPGLRVDGNGARLALINCTVESGASVALNSGLLLEGTGGCVLATAGARVEATGSRISGCSASIAGGGIAVVGAGSTLELTASVVEGCSAGQTGGGVAIAFGATGSVAASRLDGNSAGQLGGGLWVDATASAVLSASVVKGNSATAGGGVGAATENDGASVVAATSVVNVRMSSDASGGGGGGGAVVEMVDVAMADNVATKWGGGLYVCDAGVAISGNATAWSGNTALRGSSGDVLVCAAAGFEPDVAASGAAGVPWLDVEDGVWKGDARGWAVHAPLEALIWAVHPPAAVEAGGVVPGKVGGVDWLGQGVVYSGVVFDVQVDAAAVLAPTTIPPALFSSPGVDLPLAGLGVADVALVPASVTLRVSVEGSGEAGTLPVGELTAGVELLPCGIGRGGVDDDGVTTCVPCSDETASSVVSFDACVAIPDCLAGSVVVNGSTAPDCECATGFFLVAVQNSTGLVVCDPCPDGGVCVRGLGLPFPQPGFFADADASFIRCKRAEACPGRTDRSCTNGYEGYMCNACVAGWYTNSAGECVECPPAAAGTLTGGIVVLVVCAAAAVLVGLGLGRSGIGGGDNGAGAESKGVDEMRKRSTPASVSMILIVFQVIGILGDARLGWGEGAESALGAFNAFNIDSSLFASECELGSYHAKYVVSVLIPLAIIGLSFAALVAFKTTVASSSLHSLSVGALFDGVLFTVAPLLYIPMARATFELFDCTVLPNGNVVLDADPGVACFDARWWGAAPVGMLGLCTFVLGIPAYFVLRLVQRRRALLEPATFARYGALYKLFRVQYWWGGVADLGKRLAIVVAAVFASESQLTQIALLLTIFLTSLVAVVQLQPYYYPLYNTLDFRLTLILIVLLLLGGASHAERNTAGRSEVTILVGVIGVLVVLALVAIYSVVVDVLRIKQERNNTFSTVEARQRRLAAALAREKGDIGHRVRDIGLWIEQLEKGLAVVEDESWPSLDQNGHMHGQVALHPLTPPLSSSASTSSSSSSSSDQS